MSHYEVFAFLIAILFFLGLMVNIFQGAKND